MCLRYVFLLLYYLIFQLYLTVSWIKKSRTKFLVCELPIWNRATTRNSKYFKNLKAQYLKRGYYQLFLSRFRSWRTTAMYGTVRLLCRPVKYPFGLIRSTMLSPTSADQEPVRRAPSLVSFLKRALLSLSVSIFSIPFGRHLGISSKLPLHRILRRWLLPLYGSVRSPKLGRHWRAWVV